MGDIGKRIARKIGGAIVNYNMIEDGDTILAAVSGGKDSMTLMYHLLRKEASFPVKFHVRGLHIKTDFCNCVKKSRMEEVLSSWGADFDMLYVPVLKRIKPGEKMNCYWCSTQRRMELIKYAGKHGFNKIALGHHMDDMLETFFMNMAYKSELSTMLPVLKLDRYPVTIIRPLAYVKEEEIVRFAETLGLNRLVCACPYGKNSKRKEIRKIIASMADTGENIRENLFRAMGNPVNRYLPRP